MLFCKGTALGCFLAPGIGLYVGTALTAGIAFVSYPTAAVIAEGVCIKELRETYSNGLARLENLKDSMNELGRSVAAVDEDIHEKRRKMEDIRDAMDESNTFATYVGPDFDPTFTPLNESTKRLQILCTEYLNINRDIES